MLVSFQTNNASQVDEMTSYYGGDVDSKILIQRAKTMGVVVRGMVVCELFASEDVPRGYIIAGAGRKSYLTRHQAAKEDWEYLTRHRSSHCRQGKAFLAHSMRSMV